MSKTKKCSSCSQYPSITTYSNISGSVSVYQCDKCKARIEARTRHKAEQEWNKLQDFNGHFNGNISDD